MSESDTKVKKSEGLVNYKKYVGLSVFAGLIGALVMGLVMTGILASMGLPALAMMMALGLTIGLPVSGGMSTVMGGLAIHLFDGALLGLIGAGVTLGLKKWFFVNGVRKGFLVGILAGVVLFIVFGLPVMMLSLEKSMVLAVSYYMASSSGMSVAAVMPMVKQKLTGMLPSVLGAFFFVHLLLGITWGAILGAGAGMFVSRESSGRKELTCPACGMSFPTKPMLMQHANSAHQQKQNQSAGFKCPACGMSFPTQEALMQHGQTAHGAKQETHAHEHFKCKACGAEFETQDELMAHGKKSHSM